MRLICKLLLLAALWGWLLWLGAFVEPEKLAVEETAVALPGWPADAKPVRIAIVGDIHATRWDGARLDRIVQIVLQAEPEAVFLLGDFCFTTGKHRFGMPPEEVADRLKPLAERHPVYFVSGNHDLFPELLRLRTCLKKAGFQPLDYGRDRVHVFSNGQGVRLRGSTFIPEKEDAGRLRPRFSPKNGGRRERPLIAVVHNPYHFLRWKLAGDLILSGHTHGGQICMPGRHPFLPAGPILPEWQRGGWHTAASGAPLYITRGTGMTKLPVRFNCPPEISIMELRGRGGDPAAHVRERTKSKFKPRGRKSAA